MTAHSYSERFLVTFGNGITVSYTVPPGTRGVVKCVTFCNDYSATLTGFVLLNGARIYRGDAMPHSYVATTSLYVAMYPGEVLSAVVYGPDSNITVSGYLFNDQTGRTGPPGGVEYAANPIVDELPTA